MARITTVLQGGDPTDGVIRVRLGRICEESFRCKTVKAASPNPATWPGQLFSACGGWAARPRSFFYGCESD